MQKFAFPQIGSKEDSNNTDESAKKSNLTFKVDYMSGDHDNNVGAEFSQATISNQCTYTRSNSSCRQLRAGSKKISKKSITARNTSTCMRKNETTLGDDDNTPTYNTQTNTDCNVMFPELHIKGLTTKWHQDKFEPRICSSGVKRKDLFMAWNSGIMLRKLGKSSKTSSTDLKFLYKHANQCYEETDKTEIFPVITITPILVTK